MKTILAAVLRISERRQRGKLARFLYLAKAIEMEMRVRLSIGKSWCSQKWWLKNRVQQQQLLGKGIHLDSKGKGTLGL